MFSSVLVPPLSVLTFMAATSPSASASNPLVSADLDRHPDPFSFVVYALSRGSGVPEPTRAAFEDIERRLSRLQQQHRDIRVDLQVIGLEGETRLCVSIEDRALAEQTYRQIKQVSHDIDLLNVSLETCGGPD